WARAGGAEGRRRSGRLDEPPDVILLDTFPADAAARIGQVVDGLPGGPVLALAGPNSEREILAVAEAGLAGCVAAGARVDEPVAAIESAARGEALCSPSVAAALIRRLASLARS